MKVERDGEYWDMGHWVADFSGPPIINGFPGGYQNGRYVSMRSPYLPIKAFWEHYGATVIVWGFDLEQWALSGVHIIEGNKYEKEYGILPWAFGKFPAGDRLAGKYSNDDLLNGLFEEYFERGRKTDESV